MAGTPASSRAGTGIPETLLDAKGDLIAASAADTAARLAVGADDTVLVADAGAAAGVAWAALELAYAETTTNPVNCTASTEATATTIVTAGAVVVDGVLAVVVQFVTPLFGGTAVTDTCVLALYDAIDGGAAASIGLIWQGKPSHAAGAGDCGFSCARRFVPIAGSHVFSIRGFTTNPNTFSVYGGAGGVGVRMPCFIRVTRA